MLCVRTVTARTSSSVGLPFPAPSPSRERERGQSAVALRRLSTPPIGPELSTRLLTPRWHPTSGRTKRTRQVVDFLGEKWASTIHPPIQRQNEGRGDVLREKIRWNFVRHVPPALKILFELHWQSVQRAREPAVHD
jgi:hypothetical protein